MKFPERVDFAICGTQKGGTSALYGYLALHPEVCTCRKKETDFFHRPEFKGQYTTRYHRYFRFCGSKYKITGEATPTYMYDERSIPLIYDYNPKMKIIVLLRNPITRAYSNWNMERLRGTEKMSFYNALQLEPLRLKRISQWGYRKIYSYANKGFYCSQLNRIWRHFPKEQVLILKSESFRSKTAAVLSRVCQFLEIDPVTDIEEKKTTLEQAEIPKRGLNILPYKHPMSHRAKQYLLDLFTEEIKRLEYWLGWDCNDWLRI